MSDEAKPEPTPTPTPARTCGSCTACCWSMGITQLDKPERTRCSYLRPRGVEGRGGCSIYSKRPSECAAYECAHLEGVDVPRPDQCGVIFTRIVKAGPFAALVSDGLARGVLMASEARKDSFKLPQVGDLIRRVSKDFIVVAVRGRSRQVFMPEAVAAKVVEVAAAEGILDGVKAELTK